MGIKLTQIPLTDFAFDDVKSHGGWWNGRGAGAWLTQIPQISLILLLMMINLTEIGRKVVGISECSEYSDFQSSHRSNKIQQKNNLWKFVLICGLSKTRNPRFFCLICWICVSHREQRCVKPLWDLTLGVKSCGIRVSHSHRFNNKNNLC